jgi:glycosyltransferase involved in cell wall biosynthesis
MGVEKLIRNLLFRNANYLVLQSAYASNCFPAAMRSKVVIIKNFVAKSNYNLPISDSKIIGCIGRLIIAEKRQDVVLRSFKEFCRSNTDYILVFYGDGPDLRTLNNLIMEMNLTDRVKIFGYSNDLNAVYAQLKVLISASDTEGLPNVILESMASGVPVIATDYSPGGINDIITNGIDGYVVEKEDFMAISEHLTTIVNDSFLYHEMSKSARLASLKYNEFDIAQKWKDLIF